MLFLVWLLGCGSGPGCGGDEPCDIEAGRYFAVAPDGWDGEVPLPVVVQIHGYSSSPQVYLGMEDAMASFSAAGVLLVVPEGLNESWNVPNNPDEAGRDERAFLDAVLDDVAERWPVDEARVFLSGHSHGASVVYDHACFHSDRYAGFAPSSGSFWDPLPPACDAPARPLAHTHGTTDDTWPVEGRPIGSEMHQGDVHEGLDLLRATWGCEPTPVAAVDGDLTCETWACGDSAVRLCMHDGGHAAVDDWADRNLRWFGIID